MFNVSKTIETSKRFGRGCKPRPASKIAKSWNAELQLGPFKTAEAVLLQATNYLTVGTDVLHENDKTLRLLFF